MSNIGFADWLAGPSSESNDTYADLKHRWRNIAACFELPWLISDATSDGEIYHKKGGSCAGIGNFEDDRKAKTARWNTTRKNLTIYYKAWVEFATKWELGLPEITQLSSQVSNVTMAEREIQAGGGVPPAEPPKPAPDIEAASEELKAAKKVDAEAKRVEKVAKESAKDTADFIKNTAEDVVKPAAEFALKNALDVAWTSIPWEIKLAAGVAGAGFVAFQAFRIGKLFK